MDPEPDAVEPVPVGPRRADGQSQGQPERVDLGVALPNVYRAIGPLVAADVLVELTDKKRNQLWRAPDVLDALDTLATRAGRRGRAGR